MNAKLEVTKETRKNPDARRNNIHLRVLCNPAEKELIKRNADGHSLSVSRFLRELGTGFKPRSTLDNKKIDELRKINADLARLGNLLKMWLTDDRQFNTIREGEVRSLMNQLKNTQENLNNKISCLFQKRFS